MRVGLVEVKPGILASIINLGRRVKWVVMGGHGSVPERHKFSSFSSASLSLKCRR